MTLSYLLLACRVVGADRITAPAAAAQLGVTIEDLGESLPLRFRPAEPSFGAGELIREWMSNEATSLELTVAGELTVAECSRALGAYTRQPSIQLSTPTQVVFTITQPSAVRDCTLFASLAEPVADLADARVTHLRIRPDRRADRIIV